MALAGRRLEGGVLWRRIWKIMEVLTEDRIAPISGVRYGTYLFKNKSIQASNVMQVAQGDACVCPVVPSA